MQQKMWTGFFAASMACLLLVTPSGAQEIPGDVHTQMIAGKEYRITPGEKPGTWQVRYGEDTFLWEPKPWMDEELVKEGPKFFLRWAKPGLPYPWELSVEERVKLDAKEIINRFFADVAFFAFGGRLADRSLVTLESPDGVVRKKVWLEWLESYKPEGHNWENLADEEKGVVSRKILYGFAEPNEVRGLGGLSVHFVSYDRRPAEWLYLPSVRKVRRLSPAASQDYIIGTTWHYDQSWHFILPELDYKLIGFELYKGPPSDWHGVDKLPTWPDGTPQTLLDTAGTVCAVIEVTPKPGISWWFAKRVMRIAVYPLGVYSSEEVLNEKGERINTAIMRHILPPPDVRKKVPPYYFHWGAWFQHEVSTGFKTEYLPRELYFDPAFPKWLFNQDTLQQEPTTIIFW